MINVNDNGFYKFTARGKEIEVFISNDGHVEMYEINNPGNTGFYFEDIRGLIYFSNSIEDILEHNEAKNGKCEKNI